MSRTLLLCFVHGFKGNDNTFQRFPEDLKRSVATQLPEHHVESVVYPKYETSGELSVATEAFLGWLRERVMEIRKARLEKPWPPNDHDVSVVLIAHSMGGFVAADTLFLALNDRAAAEADVAADEKNDGANTKPMPIFPPIQGILAFDTPYNGLARSMFVYGAFSNYQKVSSVFNAMAALGAAAPAGLGRLATRRAASSAVSSSASAARGASSHPGWKAWQLVAVRTGTVGAIAAGGVAAYMHREAILKGLASMRHLNRESVAEGYRQGMDYLGQGLAYINRGNVGRSFAWLSDHFTFVGALMKQKELNRRLERLAAVKGVGVHDFYVSMGENGYWSGGYFVPERTFCAVPADGQVADALFERCVVENASDEVQAHMGMFRPERNTGYDRMTERAAGLVREWFLGDEEAQDDPKFRGLPAEEEAEDKAVKETLEKGEQAEATGNDEGEASGATREDLSDDGLPDESPIDIAAAASLVPLPDDSPDGDLVSDVPKANDAEVEGPTASKATEGEASAEDANKTYMQHLFRVANEAGTNLRGFWPANVKMPQVSAADMQSSVGKGVKKIPMPSMPSMQMPSLPAMPSMPAVKIFSKKDKESSEPAPAAGKNEDAVEPELAGTTVPQAANDTGAAGSQGGTNGGAEHIGTASQAMGREVTDEDRQTVVSGPASAASEDGAGRQSEGSTVKTQG